MELHFQRAAGLLIILLIGSVGANFYQYHSYEKQDIANQETIVQLEESNQKYKEENEGYHNYIENADSKSEENVVEQLENIRSFCLEYFTFSDADEAKRMQKISSYVTDALEENMKNLIDSEDEVPTERHQLTLTASDVEIYSGNANEYLASFKVKYESDIASETIQLYTMKFKMTEEKINEFTIISVQDEEVMDND